MRKTTCILILSVFFVSCNSQKPSDEQTGSAPSARTDTPPAPTNKTPVTFKGLYTYGNEVNTFRHCSTQQTYWVNDSLAPLRDSYKRTLKPLAYPYESIYAELKGYLAGKSKLGYASEYENVLVVTEIIKLEAKNMRTDCYDYEFIALGNEPFWAVDIVPAEQQIVLKDLGENKIYQFPYQTANVGGGVHRFEASNPLKDQLVIVIRDEPCSDGMSDNQYDYSAEVVINGRTLKGCAVKKGKLPKNLSRN
jgi:uncharacterized membrane protein